MRSSHTLAVGLILLDVLAVVALLYHGSYGREPIRGVAGLYLFALAINLPAMFAVAVAFVGCAASPRSRRLCAGACVALLVGVFTVALAVSTDQLTATDAPPASAQQNSRLTDHHRRPYYPSNALSRR